MRYLFVQLNQTISRMIVPTIAKLLVREHLHKPLPDNVLTLGRQTISMTYEQVLELFKQEGYIPPKEIQDNIKIQLDEETRCGKGNNYITDKVFFGLLGIKNIKSMDVTNYENADIIHNLNYTIPDDLIGQFDFIIDGGTFDHLFDVRVAFENVVKLLRPGGRILQWNAASNFTGAAYISFGPDMFFDFYTLNRFADCKVYIAEVNDIGQQEFWDFFIFDGNSEYTLLQSNKIQMTVVLGEKNLDSTWDKMPVQRQYRDERLNEFFENCRQNIQKSTRKFWCGNNPQMHTSKLTAYRNFKHYTKTVLLKYTPKIIKKHVPSNISNFVICALNDKKQNGKGFYYCGRI